MIPSQYSNTIIADSPLLYYRLGETSGTTTFDSTGNGHNGAINGTITPVSGLISKDRDGAMLLDGASGYVASGYNTGSLTAFSVECWFKLSNSGFTNYPYLFSNDTPTSSNKGFQLILAPLSDGESGYFTIGTGSAHTVLGFGHAVLTPSIYHLVAVYDGTHMLVYLNGALMLSTTASGTVASPTNDIQIGRAAGGASYFPGIIDEFAFYTTALSPTQISTHYTSGTTTTITSPQDTFLNKWMLIKVFDTSGNFIDVIRDAPYISFKDNINASSEAMRVTLPRRIDAYDGLYQPGSKNTIVLGNIVQVWIYGAGIATGGLLKYAGTIDTITPKLDEQGAEIVEIVVTPFNQVLGDHGVTSTVTFGTSGSSATYVDTGVIFQSFFSGTYLDSTGTRQSTIDAITGLPYGSPYTMDPTSVATTGQKTQFAFQNQNLFSSLNNTLLLGPANYYFRMNPNKTVYFGQVPTLPTYTLFLGQDITSIEFPSDNVPRKNVVVVQGKGVQGKYTGSSVSTLGQRVYYKSDNRITDAATAQALANGIGAVLDQTVVRAKIKIPDYRGGGMPGLGGDIEQFQIGQTVLIKDGRAPASSITGQGSVWGSFVWGRDKWGVSNPAPTIWGSFTWGNAVWGASVGSIFNQVLTIVSVQYEYFSVTLEIGTRAPSLNRKIYELQALLADATLVS